MKRLIVFAVLITFSFTGIAYAQDRTAIAKMGASFAPKASVSAPAPVRPVFSKSSINKAVAPLALNAPRVPKPAYKKAWPYVVGAIVLVLILFLTHDSDPDTVN